MLQQPMCGSPAFRILAHHAHLRLVSQAAHSNRSSAQQSISVLLLSMHQMMLHLLSQTALIEAHQQQLSHTGRMHLWSAGP